MLSSGRLLLLLCQIILWEPCEKLLRVLWDLGWGDAQHLPPWAWHPMPGKEMLRAGVGGGVILGKGLSTGP